MTNQPYQWQPQPQKPPRPRREYPGWVKVLVLAACGFVVVIVGGIALSSGSSDDGPQQAPAPDKYSMYEAQVDCEHAVEARLVSPATAEFTHTSTKPKGAGWEVRGYVDSENRMGGMVRSVFGCEATATSVRVTELSEN